MHNSFEYINLSWAVVGICENARQPLLFHIPGIDKDEAAAVEHYVIGYMAFWHIAFVDEDCLVPCNDDALRNDLQRRCPAQRCPPQDRPLHCRPSTRRDLSPLLPRPAPSADSPDGGRRYEPRVSDVTTEMLQNP